MTDEPIAEGVFPLRFLSPDWVRALDELLSGVDGPEADEGRCLVVEQRVDDGPGGAVRWHLMAGPDGFSAAHGPATAPDVSLTQDYATAAAVSRGELSAQRAFVLGRIRLGGDIDALVEGQAAFGALAGATDELRARTRY